MAKKSLLFQSPTTDADVLSVFRNAEECLSRREICVRLFRKKTPALIDRITRLADEGHLSVTLTRLPNGVDMYCYTFPTFGTIPF